MYTVKLVYKEHPRDQQNVVLYTSGFYMFNEMDKAGDLYNVVLISRWSLYTGGHYSKFDWQCIFN